MILPSAKCAFLATAGNNISSSHINCAALLNFGSFFNSFIFAFQLKKL